MNNKRLIGCIFSSLLLLAGCSQNNDAKLLEDDMQAIADLSAYECQYHNVAINNTPDAEGFLFWKKDRIFWIEVDGSVTLGIDASKVSFIVNGNNVEVSMPRAHVLRSEIDKSSLVQEAYVTGTNTASVKIEDEIAALTDAEEKMKTTAMQDTFQLRETEKRTEELLTNYIIGIGEITGIDYNVEFKYIEEEPTKEVPEQQQ